MTKRASFDIATPYLASYLMLRRGNKIAFVRRENTSWMDGKLGLIAGKVEHDETFTQAAIREAKEEAGVTITEKDLKVALIAQRRSPDSDWIDVFFEVTTWEGEPYNAEPHMHSELVWHDTNNLPSDVIPENADYLKAIKEGRTFIEYGWN